jgi:hypothetical protein
MIKNGTKRIRKNVINKKHISSNFSPFNIIIKADISDTTRSLSLTRARTHTHTHKHTNTHTYVIPWNVAVCGSNYHNLHNKGSFSMDLTISVSKHTHCFTTQQRATFSPSCLYVRCLGPLCVCIPF